jgi:hypothetical protein
MYRTALAGHAAPVVAGEACCCSIHINTSVWYTCGWCGEDDTYPHLVSSGWVQLPARTPCVLSLVALASCVRPCSFPRSLTVAVWPLRAPLSSSRPPLSLPYQRQHRGARHQHGWGHGHCHPQCPPARPLLHAPPSRLGGLGGQHPVGACGRALRARVGVAGMQRGAWRTAAVMEEAGGAAGLAVGRVCACVGGWCVWTCRCGACAGTGQSRMRRGNGWQHLRGCVSGGDRPT